jgi:LmbE family N-acetylglucosaminyl deacetylase
VAFTVVSFHAHPDDEAFLVAGTLSRLAAEGNRVILVVATEGGAGLASGRLKPDLASIRRGELSRAASALGCAEVRFLGYDDSGMDGTAGMEAFARVPVEEAARKLTAILSEVGADALTVYDPAGGYGHPDHVQVHRVGVRAAELAGTAVVLEATVDRRVLVRVLRVLQAVRVVPAGWAPDRFSSAWADPDRLTHRVDVRPWINHKRRAMQAHASQATSDEGTRTLERFLRFPEFLFRLAFGREWFVERGREPGGRLLDDPLATLRAAGDHAGVRPQQFRPEQERRV